MGRKLKFHEPSKVLSIRVPESEYENFKKICLQYLEQLKKKEKELPKTKVDVKNSYTILGINRNASEQEIKIAYKQLAKKYHPDLNKNSNAQKQFIELNNAYTELTKQEPPSLIDLMKYFFGDDFLGWRVNLDDFVNKEEIRKGTKDMNAYLNRLWNSKEYKLYSWSKNKLKLLESLKFKCYNNLTSDYYNRKFEVEPNLKPIILKGINDLITHFQRVLNDKIDVKERITKAINPIKDKNLAVYHLYNRYQKLFFNLRNQYHPKFINKFQEKYQSFIYKKIREMMVRLEEDLKKEKDKEVKKEK